MGKKALLLAVFSWALMAGPAQAQESVQMTVPMLTAKMNATADPAMKAVYQDWINNVELRQLSLNGIAATRDALTKEKAKGVHRFQGNCTGCYIGVGGHCTGADFAAALFDDSPADRAKLISEASEEGTAQALYNSASRPKKHPPVHHDLCSLLYNADNDFEKQEDISVTCKAAIDFCPAVQEEKLYARDNKNIRDADELIADDQAQVDAGHVKTLKDYLADYNKLNQQYITDLTTASTQNAVLTTGPQNPSSALLDRQRLDIVRRRYVKAGGKSQDLPPVGQSGQ